MLYPAARKDPATMLVPLRPQPRTTQLRNVSTACGESAQDCADQDPNRSRKISELGSQHRTEQWAGSRDGSEMVTE